MEYLNIAKQTYAWYKNKGIWVWSLGYFLARLVVGFAFTLGLFAILGAGIISAMASGNITSAVQLFADALLPVLVLVAALIIVEILISSAVFGRIMAAAMKAGGLEAKEVSVRNVARYSLVSILLHLALIVPSGVILVAALVGILLLGSAVGGAASVFIVLAGLLAAFLVFWYISARLCIVDICFWSRKDCGIIEALMLSVKQTSGRQLDALLAVLVQWLSSLAGFLGIAGTMFVFSLLSICGLPFVLILEIALFALIFGGSAFAEVEIYSQLSGEGGEKKNLREKALDKSPPWVAKQEMEKAKSAAKVAKYKEPAKKGKK